MLGDLERECNIKVFSKSKSFMPVFKLSAGNQRKKLGFGSEAYCLGAWYLDVEIGDPLYPSWDLGFWIFVGAFTSFSETYRIGRHKC